MDSKRNQAHFFHQRVMIYYKLYEITFSFTNNLLLQLTFSLVSLIFFYSDFHITLNELPIIPIGRFFFFLI